MLYLLGAAVALGVWAMTRRPTARGVVGDTGGAASGSRHTAIDAEPSEAVKTAIEAGADAYGLPRYFCFANAALESRFNPRAGLNTLDGGAPDGAIPERSIGLMQVNVNPGTPTGISRIREIKSLTGATDDAGVVAALKDPAFNLGFWARKIAIPLRDRAIARGKTGDDVWRSVRVGLASSLLSVQSTRGQQMLAKFDPVLAKWRERTGGA